MQATAVQAREVLADITSTACDSATSPEAVLDCIDAAERALNVALTLAPAANVETRHVASNAH